MNGEGGGMVKELYMDGQRGKRWGEQLQLEGQERDVEDIYYSKTEEYEK